MFKCSQKKLQNPYLVTNLEFLDELINKINNL